MLCTCQWEKKERANWLTLIVYQTMNISNIFIMTTQSRAVARRCMRRKTKWPSVSNCSTFLMTPKGNSSVRFKIGSERKVFNSKTFGTRSTHYFNEDQHMIYSYLYCFYLSTHELHTGPCYYFSCFFVKYIILYTIEHIRMWEHNKGSFNTDNETYKKYYQSLSELSYRLTLDFLLVGMSVLWLILKRLLA